MPSSPQLPHNAERSARPRSKAARKYWQENLRILAGLLTAWFVVSYGVGILFVDFFDRFSLPGTDVPLGFWFAQQGAIYAFVVIIFVYVRLMNRLDGELVGSED